MGRLRVSTTLLGLTCALWSVADALAKPLTAEDIRHAKKVVFYPGSFDPVTLGHLGTAQAAVTEGGADLVILLPGFPMTKQPLPIDERAKMIELTVGDHPRIAYLSGDLLEEYKRTSRLTYRGFVRRLKQLNPGATYGALLGQDIVESGLKIKKLELSLKPDVWMIAKRDGKPIELPVSLQKKKSVVLRTTPVGVSSSNARAYLNRHPNLYRSQVPDAAFLESSKLHPDAARYILERKHYLGATSNKLKDMVLNQVKSTIRVINQNLGLREVVREFRIARNVQREMPLLEINGKIIQGRFLGAGTLVTAYRIQYEGQDAVLKLASNYSRPAKEAHLQSESLQKLLSQEMKSVKAPKILYTDPEGKFIISEYIPGENLQQWIAREGRIPERFVPALQQLYEEVMEFKKNYRIQLDLRADNIVFHGDQAYIVDLGPLAGFSKLPASYENLAREWLEQAGPQSRFARCVRGALNLITPSSVTVPVP